MEFLTEEAGYLSKRVYIGLLKAVNKREIPMRVTDIVLDQQEIVILSENLYI